MRNVHFRLPSVAQKRYMLKLPISKLRRLQNSAARLVLKSKVRDHITPSLENLHWLPIEHTIIFRVLLMTLKIINGYATEYLSDLLETYVPTRTLRSATQGLLVVAKSFISTSGDRLSQLPRPNFGIICQQILELRAS